MLQLEIEGELPAKYRYERLPVTLERASESVLRLRAYPATEPTGCKHP